jgi:hypothetical protein
MQVGCELHDPAALPLEQTTLSTHHVGGLLGLRANLEATEKRYVSSPSREHNFDSSIAQPIP